MNFLLDEDVWEITRRFLVAQGHSVMTAAEKGMSAAPDVTLLFSARSMGRIFVTRDRDFGRIAFMERHGGGIVFLRIYPDTVSPVHDQLRLLLSSHSEEELARSFAVVEASRYRLRKSPGTA